MRKKILSMTFLLCAAGFSGAAAQTEKVFFNDPVVITASRYETSVSREGKDISVVTEEDIKKSGKKNLSEILESVPGVTISKKGIDGGIANIYIRGSRSGNVLILINGVKINDPMGIEKLSDISSVQTSNIRRIEIVKGAMSSMYGAEASGGVINIITKTGGEKYVKISAEAGPDRTFSESVAVSDSSEKSTLYFSGTHYSTDGISKVKKINSTGNFDNDKYENRTVSCALTTETSEKSKALFSMNYTDTNADIDDGTDEDDPNHVYKTSLFTSRGEFSHSPFAWWNYKFALSYMSSVRDDIDPSDAVDTTENDSYRFNSKNTNFEMLSNFNTADINLFTIGAEILHETGSGESVFYTTWPAAGFESQILDEKSVVTKSIFLHDSLSVFDMLFLSAGGRLDTFDEIHLNRSGDYNKTWDASASFIIPVIKTKLSTSYGTGFRAPSLYELFSKYGNEGLKPEKSWSSDYSISQELFDGAFSAGCTYFRQKYKNMISFGTTNYENIDGTVRNRGVELTSSLKPVEMISLVYCYTWIKYDETENSQAILKRPEKKHSASLTLIPVNSLSLNISYLYVDDRKDAYYDSLTWTTTNVRLDSYHKFDMNIRYALNETFTFTVRGENLTDSDYMETYGYNTKGRSFYGGAEIVL